MSKVAALLVFLLICTLHAERQIVTAPITVGVGDTLRIPAGGEVLFTGFTGITVNGRFEAIGTKDNPIVFASVNDTAGSATGFDWNGVEITTGGTAHLAYCYISGATSGIAAANPGSLALEDVIFENNGQWNLSIDGEIQNVVDRQPYSYTAQAATEEEAMESMAAPVGFAQAATDGERPKFWTRSRTKWGIGGLGVVAAAGGVVELYRAGQYAKLYNTYGPGTSQYDAATPEQRTKEFNRLRKGNTTAAIVGWSLIGAAAVDGVYITFVF